MKRNVLLAVLLAVLVAVAVWLMRDSSDAGSAAATANSTKSAEPREREALAVAAEPLRTDDARERSAVAAPDAPAAPEDLGEESAVPALAADLLEIRVIDRASQKPVVGARVVQFENLDHSVAFDSACVLRRGDFDARFDSAKDAQTSDAGGVVHFPRPHEATVIAARFENSLGFALAGESEKPFVLELVADGDLAAHVVDASGQPSAAIPVALRRRQSGILNDYALAETDGEGRAALHHAAALVGARPKPLNAWHVALRGVFYPASDVEVDSALLAGGIARLVVPGHGECEVEVLDEQGAPCTEPLGIGLRVERAESGIHTSAHYVADGGLRYEQVVSGSQLFRFVQLGSPLEAFVTRAGSSVLHRASGVGPVGAGQRTKITVRLGETACVLAGRVLDASGQPMSSPVRARTQRFDAQDRPDFETTLALTADGRFRFDIATGDREVGRRSFVVCTRDADGHEQLSAVRGLPATLALGVLDLGDLTLERSPTVAAGVALGAQEEPLANAEISVAVQQRSREDSWWMPVRNLGARTDAQGRFDIRARLALTEIQVSGTLDGRTSDVLTIPAGRADLVLHFPESGNMAGNLLLDTALSKWLVLIEARRTDAAGEDPSSTRRTTLKQPGEFELRGLRVGTYEVSVSVNIVEGFTQLARFTDVAVARDRTTRDPRLDPLDLRGQLLSFTVRLSDEHDAYVAGSWLNVHRLDGIDQMLDGDAGLGGYMVKHAIVCGLSGVDLRAGAPGMLDLELNGVKSDTTLVLRPGPRVRLVITPTPALSDHRFYIAARLEPEGHAGEPTAGPSARFDDTGVAQVSANCIGRERVVFHLGFLDAKRHTERALDTSPQSIDVRDESADQSFETKFEPVDLEGAMRDIINR